MIGSTPNLVLKGQIDKYCFRYNLGKFKQLHGYNNNNNNSNKLQK